MFDVEKFVRKINLRNKQRIVNRKFEEDGLTDEVLEMQREINAERCIYDIPDDVETHKNGFSQ